MLVSIVVTIPKTDNITRMTNVFMTRIDKSKYPRHKMEVLFIVLGSPNEGMRVLKGKPIIKVVQLKDKSEGAVVAFAMDKCHGDIIIMSSIDATFTENKILSYGQSFANDKKLAMMIEPDPGVMVLRKLKIHFPEDLFDLKSYLILYSAINKYRVIGNWGRLNRKEVKRFYYKMEVLTMMQRLHISLKSGVMVI